MSKPHDEYDPEQAKLDAARSAEVNKDMADGNGAKHFEDLLDDLHSNPSTQHNEDEREDTTDEREKKERMFQEMAREIKARLNTLLLNEGLLVKQVKRGYGGRNFLIIAVDRVRRQYEAEVDFESLGREMATDEHHAFTAMVVMCAKEIRAARDKYAMRAGLH
jgi:hypothetical protein